MTNIELKIFLYIDKQKTAAFYILWSFNLPITPWWCNHMVDHPLTLESCMLDSGCICWERGLRTVLTSYLNNHTAVKSTERGGGGNFTFPVFLIISLEQLTPHPGELRKNINVMAIICMYKEGVEFHLSCYWFSEVFVISMPCTVSKKTIIFTFGQ